MIKDLHSAEKVSKRLSLYRELKNRKYNSNLLAKPLKKELSVESGKPNSV